MTKRIHPHVVRHTTAVHLLQAGIDMITISHWLGHADIETTNRYAAVKGATKYLDKLESEVKSDRDTKASGVQSRIWLATLGSRLCVARSSHRPLTGRAPARGPRVTGACSSVGSGWSGCAPAAVT